MSLDALFSACRPEMIAVPILPGAEIISIRAAPVLNVTRIIPGAQRFTLPTVDVKNLNFCNVTTTYSHAEEDGAISVEVWLPSKCHWNQRLYSAGGGGWAFGRASLAYTGMTGAVADGYAASSTDGGFPFNWSSVDASPLLLSPGEVDLHLVEAVTTKSLGDMAVISKQVVESFYGTPPKYSYFNGCSTGGRQGLALAQQYPDAYNGISANAPAIEMPNAAPGIFWPQQLMNELQKYPLGCEIDAITKAAVASCDSLDGVTDGLVEDTLGCLESFNPFELVGTAINCAQTDSDVTISEAAAVVASGTWTGGGHFPGYSPSTDLVNTQSGLTGIAATLCSPEGTCTGGLPSPYGVQWLKVLAAKDLDINLSKLSRDEFLGLMQSADEEFGHAFKMNDPDLSPFRDAGGKLVTYHGLDDPILTYLQTRKYYETVNTAVSDASKFFRYFEVPGMPHCFEGPTGGQPTSLFQQLVDWVESGEDIESTLVEFKGALGETWKGVLCPYPQKRVFHEECGNGTGAGCWNCLL